LTLLTNLACSDTLPQVSHLILLILAVDAVALLILGAVTTIVPVASIGLVLAGFCGAGALLCLPMTLARLAQAAVSISIGPPGLSLHIAIDSLSGCFLFIILLSGSAIAAFQATSVPAAPAGSMRDIAFCIAGAMLALLAADGVTLAVGIVVTCAALWSGAAARGGRVVMLIPLLLLAAVCLLTPSGFAPRFDTIRAAPVDSDQAAASAALVLLAIIGLIWIDFHECCRLRDALRAAVAFPLAVYVLLRMVADLSGAEVQAYWGFVLLLVGSVTAVVPGWRSAAHPEIDTIVRCLVQRLAGLAVVGMGLAVIARTADLPGSAIFAFSATFISAIGIGWAGCLATLAAHVIGASAGTFRLSRLGGLTDRMPFTSATLATGLLGLAAIPAGFGFACLWLLFQSILSAPRAGGLLFQLPLALTGAAIALSSALATVASIRLIGVAILGRPRTPQGAGAQEHKSPTRFVVIALGSLSITTGALPGPVLWLLADPAIQGLTGAPPGGQTVPALFLSAATAPGYFALPVLILVALATGAVMLIPDRSGKDIKAAGLWADGLEPPVGLPFGDPAAQSAGRGFLPTPPDVRLPSIPKPRAFPAPHYPIGLGLWLLLAGFGVLLLVVMVTG
jgi:hydrogenase-4 component B